MSEAKNITDYVADMHTHTIASGHAYNTITEMATAASEKGLKMLGITEHSVSMPGTCHEFYFQNLKNVNRNMFGIELVMGVELNIVNFDGEVDMSPELLQEMDIAIASIHPGVCYTGGTIEENTNAIIGAIKNPYVNIIGHPDDSRIPLDYEQVVKASKEFHTLLEINNNSLAPGGWRVNPSGNDKTILTICKREGVPVIIGSDAHTAEKIATNSYALELIKDTDFPKELIVNYNIDLLKTYLNKYKQKGL